MLKIPASWKQTSWPFTKRGLGFENGATVKQIQVVRVGLEPGPSSALIAKALGHLPSFVFPFVYLFIYHVLFCRFRRKKSGNDWILASAKAMDIEVDEDLYPFVKFKRDYCKD